MSDFSNWLEEGILQGYCPRPVCNIHDGLPLTEEEDDLWEAGNDPCMPAVRLYYPEVSEVCRADQAA